MKALTQRKEMAILPILITGQLVIAVLVGGCGKKDPVAGLNKVQAAAKLKLVPDLPLLATRIEPTNPQPPEPFSIVPPPCAQIGLTLTLTRKSPLLSRSAHDPQPGWQMTTICYALKNGRTTFKLTDRRIFDDLKGSVLEQPLLVCTVNNGPGRLASKRSGRASGLVRRATRSLSSVCSTASGLSGLAPLMRTLRDLSSSSFPEKPAKMTWAICHAGPAGAQ